MVSENKLNCSPNGLNPFSIALPAPLRVDDAHNLANTWRRWKQNYDDFFILANFQIEPKERQLAMFRHAVGVDARKIINELSFQPTEDRADPHTVIAKFEEYCLNQTNETFERFRFFQRQQFPEETVEQFVIALKTLANSCNFCDCTRDSLIRDRIICGVRDKNLTKSLLKCHQLSLDECITICRSESVADIQMQSLTSGMTDFELNSMERIRDISCDYCGNHHPPLRNKCPAWNKYCAKCGKRHHFARKCRSFINRHSVSVTSKIINPIRKARSSGVYANLLIGRQQCRFQLDSGASVNVIPKQYVGGLPLLPTTTRLCMWNGTKSVVHGEIQLKVTNPVDGRVYVLDFLVTDEDSKPILGISAIELMNFVTINHDNFVCAFTYDTILGNFASVFEPGLGCLPSDVRLSISETAIPVALPVRGVPIALREKLQAELDRLLKLQVIAPVDEPTDWVSQIAVALKKSGSIRLCIDPKPLNAVLRRESYRLPTLDDILPDLNQAKFFTKVDLSSAFWQLKLDEESSYLTTFGTPFGRFRWLRLPFGLKVSSEIFQKRLIQALEKLTGTICIADDVLIYGKTSEEHDNNLINFLQRCVQQGIRLTPDKIEYRVNAVSFHGHLLTEKGLQADPEKIRAIQLMPIPEDSKAIFRLNGMVNYLSRFLPKLADMLQPIRLLTHKGVAWRWGEEQQNAFEQIKKAVTEAPILSYYQPDKALVIQCDSSQSGLGAVLLQQEKPLDYRSRSLTTAEQNYAQIEKEMLAVVFALERFNSYTFGRKTVVLTDHKPLISIVQKPLSDVPKRLQRMIIRIQKYDYELSYHPGTQMYLADTLSRAYEPGESEPQEFELVSSFDTSSIPEKTMKAVEDATQRDAVMVGLKERIREGWPETKEKCSAELRVFFKDRHLFSTDAGLIFKGDRIVIPHDIRKELIQQIHLAHLGVNGSIQRARELYYWPGMNGQITTHVQQCETCRTHDKRQIKEPMLLRELPRRPWQFVAADLFEHDRKHYLVTVDYYSDYFEIDQLSSTTTVAVISRLRAHFARYGIPDILFTDNGPQFSSADFLNFSEKWAFEHRTSSPYHSKSNGKAEAAVKSAKSLIAKARDISEDPYLMLLEQRNTPTPIIGYSPAQRLHGRRCRTLLPSISESLIPNVPNVLEVLDRLQERRKSQKYFHDLNARELPELQPGEKVWVECVPEQPNKWVKGTIRRNCGWRSYEVETDGAIKRRNRIHLRKRQIQEEKTNATPAAEPSRTRSGCLFKQGRM